MKKIRIGYFADGPWSHKAFEKIIKDNSIEVVFIVPRIDTSDNTLKDYSERYKIDYLFPIKINSKEFIELAKSYNCDLFVSMSFNQIFKERVIKIPKYNTINCHAGKLPFYRGRNVLNWALINDEKEFGITVHFVDEGIDTGDIILQNTYPISENDTYKTLLEVAHIECAYTLFSAIKRIQSNNYTRVSQKSIHPVGFYCGQRIVGDEVIDWNQTSRKVYNFIRAVCEPGPKAHTYCGSNLVKVNSASLIPNAPVYIGKVGQIVGKTERGFIVKTQDSTVEIFEIDSAVKLKVGDCLRDYKI